MGQLRWDSGDLLVTTLLLEATTIANLVPCSNTYCQRSTLVIHSLPCSPQTSQYANHISTKHRYRQDTMSLLPELEGGSLNCDIRRPGHPPSSFSSSVLSFSPLVLYPFLFSFGLVSFPFLLWSCMLCFSPLCLYAFLFSFVLVSSPFLLSSGMQKPLVLSFG